MMMNTIQEYYKKQFAEHGFLQDRDNHIYCGVGSTWRLSDAIGKGTFWLYGEQDLFSVKIHDFYFHEDTVMEFSWPECLGIMQYDSISGEELSPYRRLEAGIVKSFIGGYGTYKVLIHKKIPVRSMGIEIMPRYYEGYLKEQYPGEYSNPLKAFAAVGQTMDFPEMDRLLKIVRDYRGSGLAAKLYYQGKVAEAVSLIVEWSKKQGRKQEVKKKLSVQDIKDLDNITLYLNDHCLQEISLDQIVKVSYIGARRLQTIFKEYHGCTITQYIQQRRMSQAENLLANTELSIGQIAQAVGYSNASRLAELFCKSTGMLPGEYRKMAHRK
jgi:AraC-like DNA-binding protein